MNINWRKVGKSEEKQNGLEKVFHILIERGGKSFLLYSSGELQSWIMDSGHRLILNQINVASGIQLNQAFILRR